MRAVGDRACIVDLEHLDQVMSLAEQLRQLELPGVIEIVPAAATVLITATDRAAVHLVMDAVRGIDVDRPASSVGGREVRIDVIYDGEDLSEVAALASMSVEALVQAHQQTPWNAAFGGFAPGFVYLSGGDPRLAVPRRASPRTRVPAGSVALAGDFSAVYPNDSPGGWQLIGRTEQLMWDERRDPPALIQPGDFVRFSAIHSSAALGAAPRMVNAESPAETASSESASGAAFTVARVDLQLLVQDHGRSGFASLGITDAGALDRGALDRANAAVGNAAGAAGLEALNGGFAIRAERDLVLVLEGAPAPFEILDDGDEPIPSPARTVPPEWGLPFLLLAGERLEVGAPPRGMRSYLAVRGGIAGVATLGSVAYDSLAKMGSAPLQRGDALHLADKAVSELPVDAADPATPPTAAGSEFGSHVTLRAVSGPRDDWFTAAAGASFERQTWTVTSESNRIGLRLTGRPLERSRHEELPSEGVVRGSIQVPPSGLPVLFLADHPVTGGYPVIATVVADDLDCAAQLRPGDSLNIVLVDADEIGDPRRPAAATAIAAAGAVSFSIEIDGRRRSVTVAPEVAAALELLAAQHQTGEHPEALTAILEALASAVQ